MAIQGPIVIGDFNNGDGTVAYTYDDVSLMVQTIVLTNAGLPASLTLNIWNSTMTTIVRSFTRTSRTGTQIFSVPQNGPNSVQLVLTSKGFLTLPFPYSIDT